jgi:hypothetical protein
LLFAALAAFIPGSPGRPDLPPHGRFAKCFWLARFSKDIGSDADKDLCTTVHFSWPGVLLSGFYQMKAYVAISGCNFKETFAG